MRNAKLILRILIGAIMVVPALALVAFGPRADQAVSDGRVVVTYWEKWTDFEGEAMRRLVGVFNDTVGAEKGIFVDYVTTTQIDLKTLVATAGGDPPDIAGLWPHNVSSFAAKGALQPLDDRAASAGINQDLLLPVYYRQCVYHDRLHAIPLTPWSVALYYNKRIFAEFADELAAAGYGADRAPRTLDEMMGYCRILQRRDTAGDLTLMGFIPSTPERLGWYWHAWPLWYGGNFFYPGRPELRLDSEASIRAYEWVQGFAREFGQRDVIRFDESLANFNSPDNPFMTGRLAMMQQGPWFANMIRQYGPDVEWGAAPFPTHDGSEVSYCGQDVLVIPTGAKHPDEAWEFIQWIYTSGPIHVSSGDKDGRPGYEYYVSLSDPSGARQPMPALRPIEWICWIHYKNSPLIDTSADFTKTHPNPALAVHDRAARSPLARTEPPLPNWSELLAEFVAAYRDIWGSDVDVRERLEECQKQVDVLVERARKNQARYGESYP